MLELRLRQKLTSSEQVSVLSEPEPLADIIETMDEDGGGDKIFSRRFVKNGVTL